MLCCDINKTEVMVVDYWQRRPITNSRKEVETVATTWASTSTTNWTRKIQLRSFRVVAGEDRLKTFIKTAGSVVRTNLAWRQ